MDPRTYTLSPLVSQGVENRTSDNRELAVFSQTEQKTAMNESAPEPRTADGQLIEPGHGWGV